MKKEYTAPEFESLDLRSPTLMDIVGQGGNSRTIIDGTNPSDAYGEDTDLDGDD